MNEGNVVISAWSYGLAAAAYTAFALHLWQLRYWRSARRGAASALLAAIVVGALWGWFGLADQFASTTLFLNLASLADLLFYGCWYAFVLLLLRPGAGDKAAAGARWLTWVAVVVLGACLVLQLRAMPGLGDAQQNTRALLLGMLATCVFALVLVEQLLRNIQADSLWNAKPLCLGLAGGFLFDLYIYSQAVLFNGLDADALSIRGAVRALMVPLLLLSTIRRRDWIATLSVSRKAAFHSATLLLAGVYLIFISGVGYYVRIFGGDWGRALQLGVIFVALIALSILAVSGSVRAKLRVFLGKHFFRYRYDYREEWLRFTQTLAMQESPQQMGQQVVRGLADMLESPAGCLWLQTGTDKLLRQAARWNMAQCEETEELASPLCRFMVRTGWVINLEEYRSVPGRYANLELPPWLSKLPQAWLIVPLCVADDLIGFVVLASARTAVDVNWEVNDLLKTAGRQAASFLAQMQATEALLEVRKFDAFNRMSAFVVHDLKNIVTQLSLMMKNAKRLHANPEFQQDMLMTVDNALDRMRQMMMQLREGATPPGAAFGVDLAAMAQRIQADALRRGRQLNVEIAAKVRARGHEERLERVIGHMVHNAFDATDPTGRVWLKIDRLASQARVEVGDTGHGMSQEFIRERLFKPFQSTKASGMGIGAYESLQYVQELGGTMKVASEPDRGTQVTVLLPLFEAHSDSDLHMAGAA